MLAVVSVQVGLAPGETYWTFYPSPPVLHSVTWGDESVLVSANDTQILGGQSRLDGPF